jgi:hypothetical protein
MWGRVLRPVAPPLVHWRSRGLGIAGRLGHLRDRGKRLLGELQCIRIVDGSYIVDNGYAGAWEPSLQYSMTHSLRIRSFLFADQVLIRYSGQGKLWVQSRSPRSLANWVYPFRPEKSRSSNE